jgi:hypothetical protein
MSGLVVHFPQTVRFANGSREWPKGATRQVIREDTLNVCFRPETDVRFDSLQTLDAHEMLH